MAFVERVRLGERIPWSHRIAWRDWPSGDDVCWPVGVHWIARLVRWFWLRSFRWRHDAWDDACREIELRYQDALNEKNAAIIEAITCIAGLTPMTVDGMDDVFKAAVNRAADRADQCRAVLRDALAK